MHEIYYETVSKWYDNHKPHFFRILKSKFEELTQEDLEDIYQDSFIVVHKYLKDKDVAELDKWSRYCLYNLVKIGKGIVYRRKNPFYKSVPIDDQIIGNLEEYAKTDSHMKKVLDKIEGDKNLWDNPRVQQILGDEINFMGEPCSTILKMVYYDPIATMKDIATDTGYKNDATVRVKKHNCMQMLSPHVENALRAIGFEVKRKY